jgi:hypothetical protein
MGETGLLLEGLRAALVTATVMPFLAVGLLVLLMVRLLSRSLATGVARVYRGSSGPRRGSVLLSGSMPPKIGIGPACELARLALVGCFLEGDGMRCLASHDADGGWEAIDEEEKEEDGNGERLSTGADEPTQAKIPLR